MNELMKAMKIYFENSKYDEKYTKIFKDGRSLKNSFLGRKY